MKVAVCDDDTIFLVQIRDVIRAAFQPVYGEIQIDAYNDGNILMEKQKNRKYDVIFLDIDMPKISGFEIAKKLRETFERCQIVFVTSHSELVYQSFDFQPFHFVQKRADFLAKDIDKVIKKFVYFSKQNQTVPFQDESGQEIVIPIREIMYLQSKGHYIYYYTKGRQQPYKCRQTMTACENEFLPKDFVRIHKQYLVNLKYIEKIDMLRDEVKLSEVHQRLVMSRNYKKEVQEKYIQYLRTRI